MIQEKIALFFKKTWWVHLLFLIFIVIYIHNNPLSTSLDLSKLGINLPQLLSSVQGGGDPQLLMYQVLHKLIIILLKKLLLFLLLVDLPTQISFFLFVTIVLKFLVEIFGEKKTNYRWKKFFWFFGIYLSLIILLELCLTVKAYFLIKPLFKENNLLMIFSSIPKIYSYFESLESMVPYFLFLGIFFFLIFPPLIQMEEIGKKNWLKKSWEFLQENWKINIAGTLVFLIWFYFLFRTSSSYIGNFIFITMILLSFDVIMFIYLGLIGGER